MTPDEINIAIAEHCGWTDLRIPDPAYPDWYIDLFGSASGTHPSTGARITIPNYSGDLNAMHEAEKTLTVQQWASYWSFLEPLACRPNNAPIIFATAAQRAEAFLHTVGKWKEAE